MKLNKHDIRTYFHAEVCSFSYQPLTSSTDFFFSDASIVGKRISNMLKPQERVLEIEFWNVSDISKFTAELMENEVCTLNIDDGYEYDIIYKGGTSPVTQVWNNYYTVNYSVYAIQKKPLINIPLKRLKNTIDVVGTWKCPCRYIVVVKKAMAEFTIDEIKIKNLKVGDRIVIDGISKLIECNGVNKFKDSDLKEFPILNIGTQAIVMSSVDVDVSLEYYPLYI